jgi:hypothetical protein
MGTLTSLKPEVSIPIALATAGVVVGIYSQFTPSIADMRTVDANNADLDGTRRQAGWLAAAAVGAISLLAKDATPFVVGCGIIIFMDWSHRHANAMDPMTGFLKGSGGGVAESTGTDPVPQMAG